MRNILFIFFIALTFSLTACVSAPTSKSSSPSLKNGDITASVKVGGKDTYSVKRAKADALARVEIADKVRLISNASVVEVLCTDTNVLYPNPLECAERFKPAVDEYLVEVLDLAMAEASYGKNNGAKASVRLVLSIEELEDKSTLRYGNYIDKVGELLARAKRALTFDIKYELLSDARHKLLKAMVFKGTSEEAVDGETKDLFHNLSQSIVRAEGQHRR